MKLISSDDYEEIYELINHIRDFKHGISNELDDLMYIVRSIEEHLFELSKLSDTEANLSPKIALIKTLFFVKAVSAHAGIENDLEQLSECMKDLFEKLADLSKKLKPD